MKFTVIIPAFNAGNTIGRCLKSIYKNVGDQHEVIIVNDSSTDDTHDKAISFIVENQLKSYQVISNSVNRGVSYSRNRGLDLATGDYILFVDSDDVIAENTVDVLTNIINGIGKVDIVRFNTNSSNASFADQLIKGFQDIPVEFIENYYLHSSCTQIVNRSFLGETRFNQGILFGEDFLFSFELLLKSSNMVFIDDQLYIYSFSDSSASNFISTDHIRKIISSIEIVYTRILQEVNPNLKKTYYLKYANELSLQLIKLKQAHKPSYYNIIKSYDNAHDLCISLSDIDTIYKLHGYFLERNKYLVARIISSFVIMIKKIRRFA